MTNKLLNWIARKVVDFYIGRKVNVVVDEYGGYKFTGTMTKINPPCMDGKLHIYNVDGMTFPHTSVRKIIWKTIYVGELR